METIEKKIIDELQKMMDSIKEFREMGCEGLANDELQTYHGAKVFAQRILDKKIVCKNYKVEIIEF